MATKKTREPATRCKRLDPVEKEIRRLWGNMEVLDAETNISVIIRPEDVSDAVAKDPGACVFAQACKRTFDARKILFFRTVAYVEMPNEDGRRIVRRFRLTSGTRALIEAFDRGEGVIPGGGFILKSPSKGARLEYKRKRNRDWARRKLLGEAIVHRGEQGKGKYEDKPIVIDTQVRNGSVPSTSRTKEE